MLVTSKTVTLVDALDEGLPQPENFKIVESTIDSDILTTGSVIAQILVISADPYLRSAIKSTGFIKPNNAMKGLIDFPIILRIF